MMQSGRKSQAAYDQIMGVSLGGHELGLDLLRVREVRECGVLSRPADLPDFFAGLIESRRAAVPVLDLGQRFELAPVPGRRLILILETVGQGLAILADGISGIYRVERSGYERVPGFARAPGNRGCVQALARVPDRILPMLDPDRVLTDAEQDRWREYMRSRESKP
jgi:purine-binding chemotaxis protein CheW